MAAATVLRQLDVDEASDPKLVYLVKVVVAWMAVAKQKIVTLARRWP